MLALIRHGQTDWNRAGLMQGRSDIPLNDTGREQARLAAEELAGEHWDAIVASPLVRARETAEIIAARLGLDGLDSREEFVEQHFGEAEGIPVTEFWARWPDRDVPGKEPDAQVAARAIRGLGAVRQAHPGRRVLVVAHGTLIRHALAALDGRDPMDFPRLDNAASSLLRHEAGAWRVLTFGGIPLTELPAADRSA